MENTSLYKDIEKRTGGNIYLGQSQQVGINPALETC